jgi:hypothetical protein
MLYVGIIAAIQEHAYDHCRRRVSEHEEGWPRQCPRMKDLGSGEEVRQINSKVKTDKQGKSNYILETKLGLQAKSQCVPPLAPPGPLYRWPGLRVRTL